MQPVLVQPAQLDIYVRSVERHIVERHAAHRDVEALDGAAIVTPADLALTYPNTLQSFIGSGNDDASGAGRTVMHRGAHQTDTQAVTAIPFPFPVAGLLQGRLARGEVIVPTSRPCGQCERQ